MQLGEWLSDLAARFMINLPASELVSVSRICFQVEEAQWYYEDFVRPLEAATGNHLPHLPLRDFCLAIFRHCPLTSDFSDEQHLAAYDQFLAYKVRVPVRGAIMLDESMEQAVLVRGWKKGANWSFPRGKINKDEKDLHCALREVYEETGFDIRAAGLVPENEDEAKYIDVTMREQHMRLFVFRNVPLDTYFAPRTRKEISKIAWYTLRELPGWSKKNKNQQHDQANDQLQANKFYMVAPFLGPLKRWITQQRQTQSLSNTTSNVYLESEAAIGGETTDGQVKEALQINDLRSQELRQLLSAGISMQQPAQHSQQAIPLNNQDEQVRQQEEISTHYQPQNLLHLFAKPVSNHFPMSPQHLYQQPFSQPMPFQTDHSAGFDFSPNGAGPLLHENGFQHQNIAQRFPYNIPQAPSHSLYQGVLTQQSEEIQTSQSQPRTGSGYPQRQSMQQQRQPTQQQLSQQQPFANLQPIHTSHDEPSAMLAAPKASQLPAPKLNAHSMRLLQAFTQGPPKNGGANQAQNPQQPSVHQARLLDLFRSPTQTPAVLAQTPNDKQSVHNARPQTLQERSTTLDEITQTLPLEARKSPKRTTDTLAQADTSDLTRHSIKDAFEAQPLRERNNIDRNKTLSTTNGRTINHESSKRNQSQKGMASPNRRDSPRTAPSTISKSMKIKATNEQAKIPAFTILARPTLDKEGTIATSASPPLHLQGRTMDSPGLPAANAVSNGRIEQQDRLLTLFGKGPSISPASASIRSPSSTSTRPIEQHTSRQASPLTSSPASLPSATILPPQQEPSKTAIPPQNSLLNLFKNGGILKNETSISPLALGTPSFARQSQQAQNFSSPTPMDKRSEVNIERKPSSSATPIEAKGFLLGFLNDVVQKEGKST